MEIQGHKFREMSRRIGCLILKNLQIKLYKISLVFENSLSLVEIQGSEFLCDPLTL